MVKKVCWKVGLMKGKTFQWTMSVWWSFQQTHGYSYVSMFVVQAPFSPQTDSSSMIVLIVPTSLFLDHTLCYCFSPHQLKLLEAMSIDVLGDIHSRDQCNGWYGQVLAFLLLSNLCGAPSLFHNIFCRFKHNLLNAPRHATQTFRLML